jgi:transcriptional regulator with XRE-family HTH domain
VFGEELRKLRLKAGLTQEEVAARADVSREYVSMLEAEKNSPTIEVFIRLCRAIGVPPAQVIARVERSMEDDQNERRED